MVEKKIEKYYWIGGVIGVTLIIMILAVIFIISPSFKSISKVSKELKENKENLKVAEQKLEKLKELKVREDEIREQSLIVYRAIPTKKEVGDLFIQLNGIVLAAGGNGTKTTGENSNNSTSSNAGTVSITPNPQGVNSMIYKSEVTFPSYGNFKIMLDNSEKSLRFIHLDNFKIDSKDSFKTTLTYKAYYRDQSINHSGEEK